MMPYEGNKVSERLDRLAVAGIASAWMTPAYAAELLDDE